MPFKLTGCARRLTTIPACESSRSRSPANRRRSNRAITNARHWVLVAVDADTIPGLNTIQELVRHFDDELVGAAVDDALVGDRYNWLTRFQSAEPFCGFNLDRRALDWLNAIPVVRAPWLHGENV